MGPLSGRLNYLSLGLAPSKRSLGVLPVCLHSLNPSTPPPEPMCPSSCGTCVNRGQTAQRPSQMVCPGRACPGSMCSLVSGSCRWLGRRWVSKPVLAFWLACGP